MKHDARQHTNIPNEMWKNGKVTLEWGSSVIVKLPKKGNLSDYNNWRGITLLSVPDKVFCKVGLLLNWLKNIEDHLREEQGAGRISLCSPVANRSPPCVT